MRGGEVGPLHVVDRDGDRPLVLERAEQVEEPDADRDGSLPGESATSRRLGATSWATTPYGSMVSVSSQVARRVGAPGRLLRNRCTSALLPIPGAPTTATTRGVPAAASSISACSVASSATLPTNGATMRTSPARPDSIHSKGRNPGSLPGLPARAGRSI